MSDEDTIVAAVGEPWPTDPQVYTIQMTDAAGQAVQLGFQWRANGLVLRTPSGSLALRDARAVAAF